MAASGGELAFGPFQLDLPAKRLRRDGVEVRLPGRQVDVLCALVSQAGDVIAKDDLIRSAWEGLIVGDNTLAQTVSLLRAALDPDDHNRYIETAARRGYRFVAPVSRVTARRSDDDLDALLAPHRAWITGRAALESLQRKQIGSARTTFTELLASHPDNVLFHIGLANACVLQFEGSRAGAQPDAAALALAVTHAREACRLDADHAEAWATLGFVLARTPAGIDALAASRRAVALEPGNWCHHLRLAAGSWGEERLHAAYSTLALAPHCPFAHLLAATVYVARRVLDRAERELDGGLAETQDASYEPARLPAVALHWLKGLLCLARGADDEGLRAFEAELALEARGHFYSRECCANAWYAIGVHRLGREGREPAMAAFCEAITRVPAHAMAHAGIAVAGGCVDITLGGNPLDEAMAKAALRVAAGDAPAAARLVASALADAPAGNAGWLLAVDPLLCVHRDPAPWAGVLAHVRARAL